MFTNIPENHSRKTSLCGKRRDSEWIEKTQKQINETETRSHIPDLSDR